MMRGVMFCLCVVVAAAWAAWVAACFSALMPDFRTKNLGQKETVAPDRSDGRKGRNKERRAK